MLSRTSFTYYQPEAYYDDGTDIDYGPIPQELYSFQAFPTREKCEEWLKNNGYEPEEFVILEYSGDDIEDVSIIDEYGIVIPKIEECSDGDIQDMLTDEVLFAAGSIDNLRELKQDDETKDQFGDRLYGEALDKVNAAIETIEESGDYDFSSYSGNPDVDWYDGARDEAVQHVIRWMLGIED